MLWRRPSSYSLHGSFNNLKRKLLHAYPESSRNIEEDTLHGRLYRRRILGWMSFLNSYLRNAAFQLIPSSRFVHNCTAKWLVVGMVRMPCGLQYSSAVS